MSLPTFDAVIAPLFELLAANPEGLRRGLVADRLAGTFALTDEDRAARLTVTAQPAFINVVDWAHGRLKRAGWSSAPRRGLWQLTPRGMERFRAGPLTPEELASLARAGVGRPSIAAGSADASVAELWEGAQTPVERLRDAAEEIREDVQDKILERAVQLSPRAFERLVVDLLAVMGYAQHGEARHTGRAGDGGFDGMILMDRLGLDRVYMQAKRLRLDSRVDPDDVRAFFGALQMRRAHRGVFCTSGRFSDDTREWAAGLGTVRLIDGSELADLMIEFGLGTQSEVVRIQRLDGDFFERYGL